MYNQNQNTKNPWFSNQNQNKKLTKQDVNNSKNSEQKFQQAHLKLQAAVQKYADKFESSSDEEELESVNVIGKIMKYERFSLLY